MHVQRFLEAQLAAIEAELHAEEMRHKAELRIVNWRYADECRKVTGQYRHRVRQAKPRIKELQRRLLYKYRQQGSSIQGLAGIAAVRKVFHFMEGPVDVLSASTACRRWRELACAGSVWRAKAEREGILDKAKAFEIEVASVQEGALLEEMAIGFYARVFVKVPKR
jgi:hypothetical protein